MKHDLVHHQVSRKAANHLIGHGLDMLIAGDVREIELKTKVDKRIGCHIRRQLSRGSRGTQERQLQEKTGLQFGCIDESNATRTCPRCLTCNRPNGQCTRCVVPSCGFTCH